jgi:hypothetical protein
MTLARLFIDRIDPTLATLLGKSADHVWRQIDVRVPRAGGRGIMLDGTRKPRGVPAKPRLSYCCHFDEPRHVHSIGLHLAVDALMTAGVAPAPFVAAVVELITDLRAKLEAEHGPVTVSKTAYTVPRNLAAAAADLVPLLKQQWRFPGGRFVHQAWGKVTLGYEAHFTWTNR